MQLRKIIETELSYMLKHGYCETSKDQYDQARRNWKYAIRGSTMDGRDLRVIIAFHQHILIVTVIDKDN